MAIKPGAEVCSVKEQIIEDPTTGLTLQFSLVKGDPDAPVRLVVMGDFPYGNREYLFSSAGELVGTGTALRDACRPTWLNQVK